MEATESTAGRLYSPQQICIAAFVGSPVAACWFFSHNVRQLGDPRNAQKWLLWGGGVSFVLLVLACMLPLPQRFPHLVIPLGYSLGIREAAKRIQGAAVTQHVSAGGRLGSWWLVVGISLLFLIGVLALLLVGYCLFT